MKLIDIKHEYGLFDTSDIDINKVIFPYKNFRKYQQLAIEQVAHIIKNYDKNAIFIDAPTGAGKSIIPVIATFLAGKRRVLIATSNKLLQLQYYEMLKKFSELNNLKMTYIMGRNNYICKVNTDLTAEQCIDSDFFKCPYKPQLVDKPVENSWLLRNGKYRYYNGKMNDMCPYWKDKIKALSSDIVLMNTSYMVYEAFYSKEIMPFDVVVVDEFHRFDDVLTQLMTLSYSHNYLNKMDIHFTNEVISDKNEIINSLYLIKKRTNNYVNSLNKKIKNISNDELSKYVRYIDYLKKKNLLLDKIIKDLKNNVKIIIDSNSNGIKFRYLDIKFVFKDILELVKNSFIGMSATLNTPEYINDRYNINNNFKFASYIKYPYIFELKNRVIIRTSGIKVNYKNEDEVKYILFDIIRNVINITSSHNENLLIHSISNKLKVELIKYLFSYDEKFNTNYKDVLISHDIEEYPYNLYDAYNEFKKSRGKVLISSAMTEGVDLPDDECRIQIVIKVPLLDVGDNLNKYLFKHYPEKYYEKSIIILSQIFGRNIRNESDYGITFVLDSKLNYLISVYRDKFKDYDLRAIHSIDISQVGDVLEKYIERKKFIRPKKNPQFSKRVLTNYDIFDNF